MPPLLLGTVALEHLIADGLGDGLGLGLGLGPNFVVTCAVEVTVGGAGRAGIAAGRGGISHVLWEPGRLRAVLRVGLVLLLLVGLLLRHQLGWAVVGPPMMFVLCCD